MLGLLASTALTLLPGSQAFAACVLSPPAGNTAYVCDSGDSGGSLTDTSGDNTLTFPSGGTGQISGNVTFGPGSDRINMQSGTITGTVDQGDGADSFSIGAGTVAGNVQQGSGIDDFNMSGGQIGSLLGLVVELMAGVAGGGRDDPKGRGVFLLAIDPARAEDDIDWQARLAALKSDWTDGGGHWPRGGNLSPEAVLDGDFAQRLDAYLTRMTGQTGP